MSVEFEVKFSLPNTYTKTNTKSDKVFANYFNLFALILHFFTDHSLDL